MTTATRKRKTLLEKALAFETIASGNPGTPPGSEDIELALAWVAGKVNLRQAGHAWGIGANSANQIYAKIARALRAHLR